MTSSCETPVHSGREPASTAAHPDVSCIRSRPPAQRLSIGAATEAAQPEWDSYVESHVEATGYHLWRWRRVFTEVFGHACEYLIARDREGIQGVLPLVVFDHRLFGRFAVSLPFVNYGGVLASNQATATALVEAATRLGTEHRLTHVELRHQHRQFPELPVRQHKVAMQMRLATDATRAWEQLDRRMRNHIRKAEKNDFTVITGGSELLGEFYQVFSANMRDLGTPVYPRLLFESVLQHFPRQTRVFVVRQGPAPVAGAITYGYRHVVEVPWASSLRAYRPLCPNNALYWRIMQQAIADGYTVLDFGRSSPGSGTFVFKQQWGAQPSPLSWEYGLMAGHSLPDRNPQNPKFQPAIEVWKRLPLWVTTALGPQIVRFLP